MQTASVAVDEAAGALAGTTRLERTAHHEAGHAVMHLMYGRFIESISIIEDRRRGHFGMVKTHGFRKPTQECNFLCKMAGPVAELLYKDDQKISEDMFFDLYEQADLEGVFDIEDGWPRVTMSYYFKKLSLCVEVMSDSDFRGAINLLASRLIKHKYLSRERVIRQKDWELWEIYSTSKDRVKHAKKSPKKAISQMIRRGATKPKHEPLTAAQPERKPQLAA
jgi:hypothetical protein